MDFLALGAWRSLYGAYRRSACWGYSLSASGTLPGGVLGIGGSEGSALSDQVTRRDGGPPPQESR